MWPIRRPAESESPAPARRALRRGLVPAALVAALALTGTACGGDGGKAGGAPSGSPGADTSGGGTAPSPVQPSAQISAYNAFAQCMRKHGVHVPDAGQTQTGRPEEDATKAQQAMEACTKELSKELQSPR